VKRVEKMIWFGMIPVAGAAAWLARRLAQQPSTEGMMASVTTAPASSAAADDLKVISGIGPVYEQRLNAAGIRSYRDLQAAAPEKLLEIIQATPGLADTEAWIEQAKQLAKGS
jgi:predicted flap endonuclease-1-like 5' DNA nuclease